MSGSKIGDMDKRTSKIDGIPTIIGVYSLEDSGWHGIGVTWRNGLIQRA